MKKTLVGKIKLNKSEKKVLSIWTSITKDTGLLSPSEQNILSQEFCSRILKEFKVIDFLEQERKIEMIKEHKRLSKLGNKSLKTLNEFIKDNKL